MWEVRPPQKPPSKRPNAIQLGIAIALALLALGDDVGRAVFVTARSELALELVEDVPCLCGSPWRASHASP